MRLAVDARVLVHPPTGVARYLSGLLAELPSLRRPGDELELLVDRPPSVPLPGEPDRVTVLRWPLPGGDPCWRQLRLPLHLRLHPPDVLLCPFYSVPLAAGCRTVVIVHDVAFAAHPEWFTLKARLAFRLVGPSARRAARIVTDSSFSAGEISSRLRVAHQRIEVIPVGLDRKWSEPISEAERRQTRAWLGCDSPYLLHLGAVHRRRNLPLLLDAFTRLVHAGRDLRLVVAGPTVPPAPDLARQVAELGLEKHVIRREWAPEELLRGLYAESSAVAYLSSYEGFGLPALEALACGAPVVALRRASLPEVLGEAAAWIDEATPEAFAAALSAVVDDAGFADRLRMAGRAQAARFSWAEAARRLLGLVREVAAGQE